MSVPVKNLIERTTWWSNRRQLAVREFLLSGYLEGKREVWYDDGQINIREFYRRGKREGERKDWHRNGQLHCRDFYENGKLEGKSEEWSEDGILLNRVFYRNRSLEGEYKDWNEKGDLEAIHYCIGDRFADEDYTLNKKHLLIRIKRLIQNNNINDIQQMLIPDLLSII